VLAAFGAEWQAVLGQLSGKFVEIGNEIEKIGFRGTQKVFQL